MATAHAQAEWEALTTAPEPQQPLCASSPPLLAVPRGGPRGDGPLWRVLALGPWARLCLISLIQGEGGRSLREPRGCEGVPLEGVERDGTQHAVEMRGHQGIAALPQPVLRTRGSPVAGREQG
jgi:hypothetical protein